MAQNEGAPSEGVVNAVSIGHEDLTVDELTLLPPKRKAAKPDFMLTHFPVTMGEFAKAKKSATKTESKKRTLTPTGKVGQEDDAGVDTDEAPAADPDADIGEDEDAGEGAALATALAPPTGHSFEGLPQTRFQPPDCAVAVGPNHVVAAVNTSMGIYDKSGNLLRRWPDLVQFFRPVLPTGAGIFDPQVHYDHYERRYILVIAARRQSPTGSWILLAASQTSDPTGRWWIWSLDFSVDGSNPSNNWADYPMLGIDTQALYIGTNQFQLSGGFAYGKVRILNKAEIYSGSGLAWWDFWNLTEPNGNRAFTVQPCRHYRGRGNFPCWMLNSEFGSGNNLVLWRIQDPRGHWFGRTPSLDRWEVRVNPYEIGPDARQGGTSVRIETNDDRLLNAVYQSAARTQRVWAAHTVRVSWQNDTEARTGVRWYEIDVANKTAVQQRTYGARGLYYYFPVIQTDLRRNAYLTFGRSGENQMAQLRTTGRLASDPTNSLQSSALVKAGESSYRGNRWGDYFGTSRDGGDGNRVWGYGQFADSSGTWGTWLHSGKF